MVNQKELNTMNIWSTPKSSWEPQPEIHFDPHDPDLLAAIKLSVTTDELEKINIFNPRYEVSENILSLRLP